MPLECPETDHRGCGGQHEYDVICPETGHRLDPNHGYDLDWIAEMSQEQALEDATGFLCWDSVCSPGPSDDLQEWLDYFCSEHEIIQYPNLLQAFLGVVEIPELCKPRLVYCSVASIGIIAKDSSCPVDAAMEDFSYNYQGCGGIGQPVFIQSRNSRGIGA